MELLNSKAFLQVLSTYTQTDQVIYHPTYGAFTVLQNSEGLKMIKKVITPDQLAHIDITLFEQHVKLSSPHILQFKGIVEQQNPKKGREYAVYYEYFDRTLKEEIEEKVLKYIRYSSKEILHILKDISRGLSYMQLNQLVHGDVKSSNIVKVADSYKLICPVLFGKLLPRINDPIKPVIDRRKIISPEVINAVHRDIIDCVHEDYKDDVYALGLVALDMMTLAVEAPIPVLKKLERANLVYPNDLVRLVKKMVEDVLTLRLDPVACNLYIEKIYLLISEDSARFSQVPQHQRNFTTINLESGIEEENEGSGFSYASISFDSTPIGGSRLSKRNESFTPDTRSLSGMPLLTDDGSKSPSCLIDDTSLHGKESIKIKDLLASNQRGQELLKNQLRQRNKVEISKFTTPEPNPQKRTGPGSGSPSIDGGFLYDRNSSVYSTESTNSTLYSKPSVRRHTVESRGLEGDIRLAQESFGKIEPVEAQRDSYRGRDEEFIRPVQNLAQKFAAPLSEVGSEGLRTPSKSLYGKEGSGSTPRIRENDYGRRSVGGSNFFQAQVTTPRKTIYGENNSDNLDSQRSQKNAGVSGTDSTRNFFKDLKPKEEVRVNIENRSYSLPKSSGEMVGKKVNRVTKITVPIGQKNIDLRLRFQLDDEPRPDSPENSGNGMKREKSCYDLGVKKSYDVNETRKSVDHTPVFIQESWIKPEENGLNTQVTRESYDVNKSRKSADHIPVFVQETWIKPEEKVLRTQIPGVQEDILAGDQSNTPPRGVSYSTWTQNISEFKEETIRNQSMTTNLPAYSSADYGTRSSPQINGDYIRFSQIPFRDSQPQKVRKVIEKLGDGSTYEGEMLGYIKHGKGKLIYPDGRYYEGDWDDGKMTGFGILYTREGITIYNGQWQDGKFHGQGILYNPNPCGGQSFGEEQLRLPLKELGEWGKYHGTFVENNWDGYGELSFANGDQFFGYFKCNRAEGQGKYTRKDGRIWEGDWQNNCLVRNYTKG